MNILWFVLLLVVLGSLLLGVVVHTARNWLLGSTSERVDPGYEKFLLVISAVGSSAFILFIVVGFLLPEEPIPAKMAQMGGAYYISWRFPDDPDLNFPHGENTFVDVPRGAHRVSVHYVDTFGASDEVVFTIQFVEGHRYVATFKKSFTSFACRALEGDGCIAKIDFWVEDATDKSVVAGKRPVEVK